MGNMSSVQDFVAATLIFVAGYLLGMGMLYTSIGIMASVGIYYCLADRVGLKQRE